MHALISSLLERYEKGSLTRRDLVQGLAMLTATGAGASTATAQDVKQSSEPATKGAKIDHISIQVPDLPKSIAFYQTMFGFTIVSEDKPNEIVRLGAGGKVFVSLHHKEPTGIVDHYAIGVEKFNRDAVARELKSRGVTPDNNLDAGFHIKDPAGIRVQIVGA